MSQHERVLWPLWAVVGVAAFCLIGCAKRPAKPSAQPAVPKAAATWETPTDEECRQFAESLEQIVKSGDVAAFNDAIDWDAILESATGGIEGVENARRGFIFGFKRTLGSPGSAAQQVIRHVQRGGSYRLLRVHTEGSKKRALFRLILPGAGMNYHDLILMRQPDSEIRVIDMYTFASGETITQSVRRAFLPVAAEASKGILAKLTGTENDFVANAGNLQQMAQAVINGRHQQALDIYAKLPSSLQREKTILIIRLQAAQKISYEAYGAAMSAMRRYYPKDPCLDLVLVDKHIFDKEYDEALACADRLDAAVGGDPLLDVLRAKVHLLKKDPETARTMANQAIRSDESLVDAYWALVLVSLAERNFDETNRLLNTIDKKFQVQFFDLTQIPEYAEYVKSPQYQEWLKSRPPAPK